MNKPTGPKSWTLTRLPGRYAVCRLAAGSEVPGWATGGAFYSATGAPGELSVVCEQKRVPASVEAEGGWVCLGVAGPFAFSELGVMASLAGALAGAGVSLLAVSTFDTDYLMVKEASLDAAVAALEAAGHRVHA